MWRVRRMSWCTVWLVLLATLSYFAVEKAVESFQRGLYKEILGDGIALVLFAVVAAVVVRQMVHIWRCPSRVEWQRRLQRSIQMYL